MTFFILDVEKKSFSLRYPISSSPLNPQWKNSLAAHTKQFKTNLTLSDCKRRFAALVSSTTTVTAATASEFFGLWTEKCNDFKEEWKVEHQMVAKRIYEEKRGTFKKLKKSNLERVNVKKSSSSSALKKMLTSRGPFSITKRMIFKRFAIIRIMRN